MPPIENLLLVDFENVQQVNLSRLDESFQVIIFVGAAQKNVPVELVTSAQGLGHRIEWRRVDGNGNNALDFFIACELGRVLEKSPQVQCVVLSKDKGFDALLRHLNKLGLRCKRLESLERFANGQAASALISGDLPGCRDVWQPGRSPTTGMLSPTSTVPTRPVCKNVVKPEVSNYDRVIELLVKGAEKSRPRRRESLTAHVASMFQKKLSPAEVDRLVNLLFSNRVVSETDNALTYKF